jgi:acyl carrier protein
MDIEYKIIKIIKENTHYKEPITIDSNLITELNIDSFSRLMIINAIEDEFSIDVADEDLEKFKTVNDIVVVLKSKYI